MIIITKKELLSMARGGKIRKVSQMTYDLLFEQYYFVCLKNTHDKFKYLKASARMAEKMKDKKPTGK